MDDHEAIESEVQARLDEERRVGHRDPGPADGLARGPSRLGFPHPGVNDRVEAITRGPVAEDDPPEGLAIDAAALVEDLRAEGREDVPVGRSPGTHHLAGHAIEVQRRQAAGRELGQDS